MNLGSILISAIKIKWKVGRHICKNSTYNMTIKLHILFDLRILTTNFKKVYDNTKKPKMHYMQKISTVLGIFLKKKRETKQSI